MKTSMASMKVILWHICRICMHRHTVLSFFLFCAMPRVFFHHRHLFKWESLYVFRKHLWCSICRFKYLAMKPYKNFNGNKWEREKKTATPSQNAIKNTVKQQQVEWMKEKQMPAQNKTHFASLAHNSFICLFIWGLRNEMRMWIELNWIASKWINGVVCWLKWWHFFLSFRAFKRKQAK